MSQHLPECDLPIDAGIAYAVAVLRKGGVETFESCEGGHGHACKDPNVRFYGNTGAGYHAVSVAMDYGLPIAELQRSWQLQDGELVGPYWRMTFFRKCPMPDAVSATAPTERGHIKMALIDLLLEAGGTGLNARCAVEMGKQRGITLERQTVASLLSRMKRESVVDHDGTRYRLKQFSNSSSLTIP